MSSVTAARQKVHHQFLPLRKYPFLTEGRRFLSYPPFHLLNPYLMLVIAANFFCIFMKSYGGDMDYWRSWTEHLAAKGYEGFKGNYPPLYVHWLYIVGKIMVLLDQPIEVNNLLKFLTQLPVVVSHLVLTRIVFSLLMHRSINGAKLHAVMLLTTLNPALLLNGPIWGQVDIFPVTFIVCALYLLLLNKYLFLALPLFTLAILTKFQMICFAPVFGIIFFRDIKNTLIGTLLSLIVIALVLFPMALTDSVEHIIRQAYIDTLGQYPYTTYNAANLWMLLTGNTWPDNHIFFGFEQGSLFAILFTAKYMGIAFFAIACLWAFMRGMKYQFRNDTIDYSLTEAGQHVFYAMFCAAAFFVLLPGMHERYLVPATVIALIYSAIYPERMIYAILMTLATSLNISMIHGINGSQIWHAVSILSISALFYILADFTGILRPLKHQATKLYQFIQMKHLPSVGFITATIITLFLLHTSYRLNTLKLDENQKLLTELKTESWHQDFGKLQINRNLNNGVLSLGGKKYAFGLGTHANSNIVYMLPEGVEKLSFIVGIDDGVNHGEVIFSVLGDGKRLWRSSVIHGNRKQVEHGEVNLTGVKKLTLHVDAKGPNSYDHANWVNLIITFKNKEYLAALKNEQPN
jgi:Gpi18-like mannosyltransferase